MRKICLIASSGGHFEQILMLKSLINKYSGFIITEHTEYNVNVEGCTTYYLLQVNRQEKKFPFLMILNFFKSFRIYMKEKPDVIISTGALSTIPICLIGKLFNKKIIFIESFAKVNSGTLTGKLMYRFADQFYVQWESMKEIYPKAIYVGGIY